MKYSEYNENKLHGEVDFPIQLYHIDHHHPQYIMPLHWHKSLEIIKVISGQLNLYIDNALTVLHEGDIAIVNCRCMHRGEPKNCVYECIVCALSMLIKQGNEIYSSYISPIIVGEMTIKSLFNMDNSKIYEHMCSLFELLKNKQPFYELSTIGMLFLIFEQFYLNNYVYKTIMSQKSATQSSVISDLIKWIDNNFSEHITLDLLAKKTTLTPNYLCKIFKEYTGKTPIEYVNNVRIDNICYEIKWGEKNITEAALDNGYNDISYFCKVFKKHKGMSAKKYIEQFSSKI